MISQSNLAEELSQAQFGDRRLSKRLGTITRALGQDPAKGFPVLCGSDSALEGLYRFLGNEKVSPEKILAPHIEATCRRMEECNRALILHDTTCFMFPGEEDRTGLHRYSKHKQGYWGHFALAVSLRGSHPLGVVGFHSFIRDGSKKEAKHRRLDPNRESMRWTQLAEKVEQKNAKRAETIHVMDREADNNQILGWLIENQHRFVIRVRSSRLVESSEGLKEVYECKVLVSARKDPGCPHERKFYPARDSREATLTFFSGTVSFKSRSGEALINVVIATEKDPPEGEKPVDWRLFTSQPIETQEQVEEVVDIYRKRWLIEEFFKALKTGCAYEDRQLQSRQTLMNALAVFAPLAAQMLLIRSLSRTEERIPLHAVFTKSQVAVLRRFSKVKLPKRLSVLTTFQAIATMGGHLKSNGRPGWIVLWRGFHQLMHLESAWTEALRGCDR